MEKNNKNQDISKKFLLEFFQDCNISDNNGVLTISGVPIEFENFVGKKSPYKFVFDITLHNKVPDSELIMQGSYFLLAIRDFLRDKGQTSLQKINIKPDLNEIRKISTLKKYKILEVKQSKFDFIYKFSFLSNYQYLNDKKQSNSVILIKDKSNINLDLNKFKTLKGNKEEISQLDPTAQYDIAKKILDKEVSKQIKPIKSILKEKLEKELHRIKSHYQKQIKEKDEEVEACANKIKMLQSKLRHTSYDRDISILKRLIRESTERLEMLKKKSYRERLKAEELFHINDEVEKHALSVKNILINLTVIYYLVFELISSKDRKKISIVYDPILDKII